MSEVYTYHDLSESLRHKAEADEMLSAERKVHDNKTQGFCVKKTDVR